MYKWRVSFAFCVRNYSYMYKRDWILYVYVIGWKSRPNTILIYNLQYGWTSQPKTISLVMVWCGVVWCIGMVVSDDCARQPPQKITMNRNNWWAGEKKKEKREKISNGLMRIINVSYGFILVISFNCQLIYIF